MCLSDLKAGSSFSLRLIIGIAAACTLLVLLIVGVGIYAIKQKSQAERALSLSRPFGEHAKATFQFLFTTSSFSAIRLLMMHLLCYLKCLGVQAANIAAMLLS